MPLQEASISFLLLQFLDTVTATCFFVLFFYVLLSGPRSPINRAASLFVASFFIWSFFLTFSHNPYVDKDAAIIFYNLGSIGWASVPSLALYFASVMSENKIVLRFKYLLFIPSIYFIGLQWAGFLAKQYANTSWGWAFVWSQSIWALTYYFYLLGFTAIAIFFLILSWKNGADQIIRKQAAIITITGALSVLFAFLSDVVLPKLNLFLMPNIAPSFALIFAGGLVYSVMERNRVVKEEEDLEYFYNRIIESVADPIFVKDRQHRWVLLNGAFCGFMGHRREELIGKSDPDFFPSSEAKVFWAKDNEVYNSPKPIVNEELFTDASGKTHVIITTKSNFEKENGEKYLVGIIKDITNRKSIEESLAKSEALLRMVITNLQGVIFSIDNNGIFTLSEGKGLATLGLKPKQVVGLSVYDVYKDVPEVCVAIKNALAGQVWSGSLKIKNIVFDTYISPIFDDNQRVLGVAGISTDITDRELIKNELQDNIHELERLNKVMVGRELQMIELKEELKRLKGNNG